MTQPQSGISTRNLLVLGGLSALLATPAARTRVLALLQGPLEGAQDLFKDSLAPTVQHAAQQAISRAGELGVDARKAAVHAAAQVQDGLPGLIDGVRGQASSLAGNIADSTAEFRSDLGERAIKAAAVAAKTAASVQERFEDVQESAGKRAHALLESAADAKAELSAEVKKAELGKKVGEFQASVQKRAHHLADDVQDAAQDRLKEARKAVGLFGLGAAKAAESVQEKVQNKVQVDVKEARKVAKVAQKDIRKRALKFADNAQDEAQDRLKDARKSAGKLEVRARKEAAEQTAKAKKHVAQTIDAAQGSLQARAELAQVMTKKELKGFDKRSRVQFQAYQARMALLETELARSGDKTLRKLAKQKAPRSRGGTVFTVLLLVGGGVVLARVPAARQAILNGVGALSPEAETWLRNAGHSVRNLIGTAWLERLEEPGAPVAAAAAAPAPKDDQATGSAAYASVEPGSPAADQSPITKPN